MAGCSALLLPLLAGLSWLSHGGPLEVEPPEPVVAVGGSLQLTCRLACADPAAASVRWRGLDTSLSGEQPIAGGSVLAVSNASLAQAGLRLCEGSCGAATYQRAVRLQVFAFPDQLAASPGALVAGRDRKVACTAHNVTHVSDISLSLVLGGRELEGAQALDRTEDVEAEPPEDEEPLFQVTQQWLLPPFEPPNLPTLHCQATMRLSGLELSHLLPIPVLHSPTTQEPLLITSLEANPDQEPSLQPPASSVQPLPSSPWIPTSTPENSSTAPPCQVEIHQSPVPGGLELLCEATCDSGVTLHWTQAPGGLAAYSRRKAGMQAWLSVQWAQCSPEGLFQCRLDPGGWVASLYLVPEACYAPISTDVWTGSLVLGLLLLALLAYRLRKHCQPAR